MAIRSLWAPQPILRYGLLVSAFLIGAGIAWLIFDRSRSDEEQAWSEPPEEFYEPEEGYAVGLEYEEDVPVVGTTTEPIGEAGSSKTGEAKEKARQTARGPADRQRRKRPARCLPKYRRG